MRKGFFVKKIKKKAKRRIIREKGEEGGRGRVRKEYKVRNQMEEESLK